MKNKVILAGIIAGVSSPAFAGEPCRSAKDFVRLAQGFYGPSPELTNIITPELSMVFRGINGHPVPSHILFRHEGTERRFAIVDGTLVGIEEVAKFSKDSEMCRLIAGEMAPDVDGDTTAANLVFTFSYKRRDGNFTIDEILEGAKDGSKVLNGLAPSGLGFAVPGLKAIVVTPAEGKTDLPSVNFSRKGKAVSIPISKSGTAQFLRLKDIRAAKADTLQIEGDYKMVATFKFDPDDMAKEEAARLAKVTESEN
ncbi:hypothetical protein GCM10011309_23180 [Litorimonas cladophorae]|uniref:Uncharacterized protein n=1 Tax=Litorimonas cladophorae TaxID=1220491 RepID=A0A918KSZ2_9PROT|nr:hypothetical protein [Litorimonas cladophorae]GGX72249.1 hypothetical protein GCM10011309_23180 [Litorimonas cladophorae]